MRGADMTQIDLFSCRTLEEKIPANNPMRKLHLVVDAIPGYMVANWMRCMWVLLSIRTSDFSQTRLG